jgi:hypothetical protein
MLSTHYLPVVNNGLQLLKQEKDLDCDSEEEDQTEKPVRSR